MFGNASGAEYRTRAGKGCERKAGRRDRYSITLLLACRGKARTDSHPTQLTGYSSLRDSCSRER